MHLERAKDEQLELLLLMLQLIYMMSSFILCKFFKTII